MSPRIVPPLRGPCTSVEIGGYSYSVRTDPTIPQHVVRLFGSDGKGVEFNVHTGEIKEVTR